MVDLPKSTQWVGNPVRKEFSQFESHHASEQLVDNNQTNQIHCLIIGGSQGAQSFNTHLPSVFAKLIKTLPHTVQLSVWHQTGRDRGTHVRQHYEFLLSNNTECEQSQQQLLDRIRVSEFIDDMPSAFGWADVLICRAGAMTIAECCASSTPAVLIPYPFSAGQHQDMNAQAMVNAGAGMVIQNNKLKSEEFSQMLIGLFTDKPRLVNMGKAAYQLHKPNALSNIVDVCTECLDA